MHAYRSHTCADLNAAHVGQEVRLSGWVHRVRDHGGVLFVDLRDHYGITQVIADSDSPAFADIDKVRAEWVVCIDGRVKARDAALVNPKLATGEIEVYATGLTVLGEAADLPMPVFGDVEYPEETRLTYRFLDLRREKLHRNMMLRSNVVRSIRNRMWDQGFNEFQTPDHHGVIPRRRARLPGAVAPASRQILRPAAGPATVQTADHGRRVSTAISRLRRVSATKTPAPTAARPTSISLISKCLSSSRKTSLPPSSRSSRGFSKSSVAAARSAPTGRTSPIATR